jgi:hypothetical protein
MLLASSFEGPAQIIEFETNGLKYQTLTRNGLTIMFAQIPAHVREYSILQVAVSNGSTSSWTVKPEDFLVEREDGTRLWAVPARDVVNEMIDKASRGDVIRLVTAYESYLYGNQRYKATNGYEARRQNALAEVGSTRIKAAAAASAIVFVQTRLKPGESTDGAVFYATNAKPIGAAHLRVRAAGSLFEFPVLSSN